MRLGDLYDSIAAGNHPEWKLFIQIINPDHEDKFDFDPLDVTKTWPEDILPLMPVGRLALKRNIDNFFAENEQFAFCPSIVVPGVYYSDDKLIQTRIFTYSDTRHRFGPDYLQLLPKVLLNALITAITMKVSRISCIGMKRQERFICRWIDALSDPRVTHEIRSIWLSYWCQIGSVEFWIYKDHQRCDSGESAIDGGCDDAGEKKAGSTCLPWPPFSPVYC
ncbi:hypothetical protein NL676_027485 [Syzygium grande]|nr:hypothetical protein NL676_027485 [Syzygium grande]